MESAIPNQESVQELREIEPYFPEVPSWATEKAWSSDPSWKGVLHFAPGVPGAKKTTFPWGLIRFNSEQQSAEVLQGLLETCKSTMLCGGKRVFVLPFFPSESQVVSWNVLGKEILSFDIVLLAPDYSAELPQNLPDELFANSDTLLRNQGWKVKAINLKVG